MKYLFVRVLCQCLALCIVAGNPVATRYVWMSDGDGVSHLVDLQETVPSEPIRSDANIEYWLFTRSNPAAAQILVDGDWASISNSNYNGNHPLVVITHGWKSNGNSGSLPDITSSFLALGAHNVIVVDWRTVASGDYVSASRSVPAIGESVGNFLVWLIGTAGGDWSKVHVIGASLGAHVAGSVGRTVGGRAARVTGLDPAGPLWWTSRHRLSPSDGVYVEAIHTDGGYMGIMQPSADADFYPNGGRHPQPGCNNNDCSHSRAGVYFASSVRTDHFVAYRCDDLRQAEQRMCRGETLNMGNGDFEKRGSGIYGLVTRNGWPY